MSCNHKHVCWGCHVCGGTGPAQAWPAAALGPSPGPGHKHVEQIWNNMKTKWKPRDFTLLHHIHICSIYVFFLGLRPRPAPRSSYHFHMCGHIFRILFICLQKPGLRGVPIPQSLQAQSSQVEVGTLPNPPATCQLHVETSRSRALLRFETIMPPAHKNGSQNGWRSPKKAQRLTRESL